MSSIELRARMLGEALAEHASSLVQKRPDAEIARLAGRVNDLVREYGDWLFEEYGWSSPFNVDDGNQSEEDDLASSRAGGRTIQIAAVVSGPTVGDEERGAVAKELYHDFERYLDLRLPAGYHASEISVQESS